MTQETESDINGKQDRSPFLRRRLPLLAILLFATIGNLVWIATHAAPYFNTLNCEIPTIEMIQQAPLKAIVEFIKFGSIPFPTGYHFVAALVTSLIGYSADKLIFTSTLFYLLLILAVYDIVRSLANERGAAAAAITVALIPGVFAWSRIFSLSSSISSMTIPALGVWAAVRSEGFSKNAPTVAFGLTVILALRFGSAVSDFWQNFVVLGLVGLYTLIQGAVTRRRNQRRTFLLIACATVVLVLLSKTTFFQYSVQYLYQEGVSEAGDRYRQSNLLYSPQSLFAYCWYLWKVLLNPFFALATVAASVFLLRRLDRREAISFIYFWATLALFSVIGKKNFSYIFCLLPGAAVIIGLAIGRLRRTALFLCVMAVIVAIGGWQYVRYSYFLTNRQSVISSSYSRFFDDLPIQAPHLPRSDFYAPDQIARELAAEKRLLNLWVIAGKQDMDAMAFRCLIQIYDRRREVHVFPPPRGEHPPQSSIAKMPAALPNPPDVIVSFIQPAGRPNHLLGTAADQTLPAPTTTPNQTIPTIHDKQLRQHFAATDLSRYKQQIYSFRSPYSNMENALSIFRPRDN